MFNQNPINLNFSIEKLVFYCGIKTLYEYLFHICMFKKFIIIIRVI